MRVARRTSWSACDWTKRPSSAPHRLRQRLISRGRSFLVRVDSWSDESSVSSSGCRQSAKVRFCANLRLLTSSATFSTVWSASMPRCIVASTSEKKVSPGTTSSSGTISSSSGSDSSPEIGHAAAPPPFPIAPAATTLHSVPAASASASAPRSASASSPLSSSSMSSASLSSSGRESAVWREFAASTAPAGTSTPGPSRQPLGTTAPAPITTPSQQIAPRTAAPSPTRTLAHKYDPSTVQPLPTQQPRPSTLARTTLRSPTLLPAPSAEAPSTTHERASETPRSL
mmetsp:Transcript_891/g.2711  ORF Transcript_891/g.2711 Transcript_891/m.2711 type:complete len:285 (-) Transcript_891:977-1831(-)